jgi:hypothetical protein
MERIKLYKLIDFMTGIFKPILQVFKSLSQSKYDLLIFLIIPLIYLLNASVLHYYQGTFFLGTVDPEYFYIYNGFVISQGNLSVQYIAHPGIPLQFLIAISTAAINIFQPGDNLKNFIDDPEKYIHAANLFMNVLISIVLFICGIKSKKYSGSYFTALLFQLCPFGSASLLSLSRRLIPEGIMIIPLLLTGLMVIKHIYNENKTGSRYNEIVLYGIIIGFGTACKLSFIPVILIPLVLLQTSVKQKISLVLYTLLFFAIFAYPVVFNFNQFWHWVSGIFTHSGKYGGGAEEIIDFASVPANIKYLFENDRAFFYISIISLALSGLFSLRYLKNEGFSNSRIARAILAVNIAVLVSVAFTLKHFALYYFMPFYLFKYFLVLLSAILVVQYQRISGSKGLRTISLLTASIFVLFMTYVQAGQVRSSITSLKERNETLQQQCDRIISLVEKDRPVIMYPPYYGAPFIEFAHFNGYLMTNHLRSCFTDYLKEKFPLSFQYITWSDKFYYWGEMVDIKTIIDKTRTSFYIYIGKGRGSNLTLIEDRIWEVLDKNKITRKVLFQDTKTEEQLIEIIPGPKP